MKINICLKRFYIYKIYVCCWSKKKNAQVVISIKKILLMFEPHQMTKKFVKKISKIIKEKKNNSKKTTNRNFKIINMVQII